MTNHRQVKNVSYLIATVRKYQLHIVCITHLGLKQNLNWIEGGSLWEMPTAGDWQERDSLDLKRYIVEDNNTFSFSESAFSDRCIGSVFEDCLVPDDCFTLFLGKRYSKYLISHAMLFLLFAKKVRTTKD